MTLDDDGRARDALNALRVSKELRASMLLLASMAAALAPCGASSGGVGGGDSGGGDKEEDGGGGGGGSFSSSFATLSADAPYTCRRPLICVARAGDAKAPPTPPPTRALTTTTPRLCAAASLDRLAQQRHRHATTLMHETHMLAMAAPDR